MVVSLREVNRGGFRHPSAWKVQDSPAVDGEPGRTGPEAESVVPETGRPERRGPAHRAGRGTSRRGSERRDSDGCGAGPFGDGALPGPPTPGAVRGRRRRRECPGGGSRESSPRRVDLPEEGEIERLPRVDDESDVPVRDERNGQAAARREDSSPEDVRSVEVDPARANHVELAPEAECPRSRPEGRDALPSDRGEGQASVFA